MRHCWKSGVRAAIGLLILASFSIRPSFADDQGKSAKVEITAPTRIPGATLKPGSYVFKVASSDSGWNIVEVYNGDQTSLVTTVLAYPNAKIQRSDEQILLYPHGVRGTSRVMEAWFIDGENEAQQWAYPNTFAEQIGKANRERIPTTGTEDVHPSALPKAAESWTTPVSDAPQQTAQNENSMAATNSPATAHARKLPKTASYTPLAALVGMMALMGIAALRLTAKFNS